MRPRWLLLGVSVLLLLVLFPAAALSQGHRVNSGCGTATIDGHVGDSEWATAATAPLYYYQQLDAPAGPEGISLGGPAASQLRVGTGYLMNDGRFLYLGAIITDPNNDVTNDPVDFQAEMGFAFEDEPADDPDAWVDCTWEAESCQEPEDEGLVWASTHSGAQNSDVNEYIWFGHYAAPHTNCYDSPPFSGVTYRGLPQGPGAHMEMRVNLNTSPLNNPRPASGDCFDLRWLGAVWYANDGTGEWGWLGGGWPLEPVDQDPATGQCTVLCLNPCAAEEVVEEQFVPEPASMMLLGSGLAGLAGYTALRWRSKK
jgi:hypothetical protein